MRYHRYDIVFGVSTFKSVPAAIRFLRSTSYLAGNNLIIMVGSIPKDIKTIMQEIQKPPAICCDLLFMSNKINSHVMGRSWPFVWCVNNAVDATYYCESDDDLEFTESSGSMFRLLQDTWNTHPYAMMGFDSSHPMHYPDFEKQDGTLKIGVPWLDGNFITTRWEDNEKYGLMDSFPESPLIFFTETEYAHRFRYFTGRPIVVECREQFYLHHFRNDPMQNMERRPYHQRAINDGERFFLEKFGIVASFQNNSDVHKWLYDAETSTLNQTKFAQHLLFDRMWNEWDLIYEKYKSNFTILGATI